MTVQRIRLAFWIYLPLYLFLTTVQYASGFFYVWQIEAVTNEWTVVIVFNLAKFVLASTLCLAALSFSW